jgi:nucleoside-diphosphate-sugar epimerase
MTCQPPRIRGIKFLVTGASGFLGRHLVPALLEQGHAVACLTRHPDGLPAAWGNLPRAKVSRDGEAIHRLCAEFRPEVVIHLAAYYVSEHHPEDITPLIEANLLLGAHLLEAMRACGCRNMVWTGTSWQHYQDADYCPVNLYAATKQAFSTLAEYYLDAEGFRLLELHLYDSYGEDDPRQRLLSLLEQSAQSGAPLAMSPGEQRLHLVHVDDLVAGLGIASQLITGMQAGERRIYRLPSAKAVSLQELLACFNAADPDHPAKVEWGARPYRRREVFSPWENAPILPGWVPRLDLKTGLTRYRNHSAKQSLHVQGQPDASSARTS